MDELIETMRASSTLVQALAVTAGGLVGVFLTLGLFFILIKAGEGRGGKEG